MINPAHDSRSFEMSDKLFNRFKRLTLEKTGIHLDETKRAMIVTRFSRRLRMLGLSGFDEYLDLVAQPDHPESVDFIDTVTSNLTYLFREPHHFEMLRNTILPALQKDRSTGNAIRIWSAGCSSGQEPYSITITAAEANCLSPRPVRILCKDIDSKMVGQTERGAYSGNELRGLAPDQVNRWFSTLPTGHIQIKSELRALLICRYLNLFGPWSIRHGVDVIFLRNVLIYFDTARQERLIRGMAAVQPSGGILMLGHSETIPKCGDVYKRVSNTIYQRV